MRRNNGDFPPEIMEKWNIFDETAWTRRIGRQKMRGPLFLFSCILLAGSLCGCAGFFRIVGPDLPQADSATVLRWWGEDEKFIQKVVNLEELDKETFFRLSRYSSRHVKRIVGMNPFCPVELQREFTGNSDWYVRRGVALNRNAPEDLLRKLSKDKNKYVRMSTAQNSTLSKTLILEFLACGDPSLNHGLAQNPAVDSSILWKLFRENPDDDFLRCMLACNPKLPPKLAAAIYEKRGNDGFLLLFLSSNPNCPEAIKEAIRNSSSQEKRGNET